LIFGSDSIIYLFIMSNTSYSIFLLFELYLVLYYIILNVWRKKIHPFTSNHKKNYDSISIIGLAVEYVFSGLACCKDCFRNIFQWIFFCQCVTGVWTQGFMHAIQSLEPCPQLSTLFKSQIHGSLCEPK
jgi:hypothetical protein